MNILIVNNSDNRGGAAKAAYRLHRALLEEGIDSKMLVLLKSTDDNTVIGPINTLARFVEKVRSFLDYLPVRLYRNRNKTPFSPNWVPFSTVVSQINQIKPDIVHLHWIAGGMINLEEIAKIKVPVIWSLHDNWAFTGGCYIKWTCEKYKESCGNCPNLNSDSENDLSRRTWKRKNHTLKRLKNITIVGLSQWMAECAKESSILTKKQVVQLPNPINTDIFKPLDKIYEKGRWNLTTSKKIVLFGAINSTKDINKGYNYLMNAFPFLDMHQIELMVFGNKNVTVDSNIPFKIHFLGHLSEETTLASLYCAADVMVVPSLQENLSNAIMESLACGTPVVAFDVGGNSDMVEHLKNGYLAQPFDSEDLARGISWVLNNESYSELTANARKKIIDEFDSKLVATKYINLYKNILEGK